MPEVGEAIEMDMLGDDGKTDDDYDIDDSAIHLSIPLEQQDILTMRLKCITGLPVDDEELHIEMQAQKVHLVNQFYEHIKTAYGLPTPEEVNYGIFELSGMAKHSTGRLKATR